MSLLTSLITQQLDSKFKHLIRLNIFLIETEPYLSLSNVPEYQEYLFQLAEELFDSPIYHPVEDDPPYVQVLYHESYFEYMSNYSKNETYYGYDATDTMLDHMLANHQCGMVIQ